MEESVNIEFLYGGCLPLQPGSQLSYTPILYRLAADLINIADLLQNVKPYF